MKLNLSVTLSLTAGLLILILLSSCSHEGGQRKPNVIIIYTDDQGTLDAGCYGAGDLYTPNIDRLSRSGIRFTQAYAHTVCCPSRAAMITGSKLPDCSIDGYSLLPVIEFEKAVSNHKVLYFQWKDQWSVREGRWNHRTLLTWKQTIPNYIIMRVNILKLLKNLQSYTPYGLLM